MSPCHYHTCTVNIHEDIILKLERFVVVMYCRTSGDMNVNTAWMILFSQMSRNIDNIPPTQAALHQQRSPYQSGHMWGQSLEVQPELPVITDCGWETSQTAGYIPKWTTLPIAEVAYLELISCKCAKSCQGKCNVSRQTWNAPHFANVVGPAISRRLELCYVVRYLGMRNDTEKDWQCSRHRDIEHCCPLNEMER